MMFNMFTVVFRARNVDKDQDEEEDIVEEENSAETSAAVVFRQQWQ